MVEDMGEQAEIFAIFVLYLVVVLVIGVWVYRRTQTLSDFVLGGRRLSSVTAALSAGASDMSAWLLMGLPGAVYVGGISAGWIGVGLATGVYVSWLTAAARLRNYTELATDVRGDKPANALTLSSYLEHRFEDRRGLLRGTSAAVIIVFFVIYVASGLVATGVLFEKALGLSVETGMLVGGLTVVGYTFLGGFLAVSYTDVVQGTLMWFALLVLPIVAIFTLGGPGSTIDQIDQQVSGMLSPVGAVEFADGTWTGAGSIGAIAIISSLAWGFGYFGQPHILARFMGISSSAAVPAARRIGTFWSATGLGFAILVGVIGVAYYADNPYTSQGAAESVFLDMAVDLMPGWVAGILLAGVLGAIMSTADSQLLVVSSALTEDVYRAWIKRDATARQLVWIGRGTVIVVALVAYALAIQGGTVLDLVSYAWAGFGAAFGPVVLLSLYWRRFNRVGALASMVTGAVVTVLWNRLEAAEILTTGLYEMVPAVLCAFAAAWFFNRFGPAPSTTMTADFDRTVEVSRSR